MFFDVGYAFALMEAHQREEREFARRLSEMPIEQQTEAIRIRNEIKAKIAQEAKEERRHQELCRAIRDSRPRGLGIFW